MQLSYKSLQKLVLLQVFLLGLISSQAQDTKTSTSAQEDTVQYNRVLKERAKGVTITGTIMDAASHKPLSAVRVFYQDYSAAITDSVGRFSLKVPDYKVAIQVGGEGYQLKEIALRGRKSVTTSLAEENFVSVYDVAQMPFGSVQKNKIPYAATSLDANGNWGRPAETPDAYLQGRVAGLNAIRRSGTPNAGANLFLRGITSLYTTNQPLFVVDGVIFDVSEIGTSIINNNYTNPLAFIDAKDIDNITVIKDGSSTYGTQGANGVVIITTTRARELGTRIDFGIYTGVNFATKNMPVLNADQYRTYLSDVLQSSGLTQTQIRNLPYLNDDPFNPDYYRYHYRTDWQKQVLDNSSFQNYYLKITGGDNIAKYALSLGYLTNGGIIRETDMNRYNTRFNADLNLSRRLTASANLSFTFNEQNLKDQGLLYKTNPLFGALIKSPFTGPNDVSSKGIESPTLADSDTFNVSNPSVLVNKVKGYNSNYRFAGNVGFNYSFTNTVSLNTVVSINIDKIRESYFIPRKGVVNDTLFDGQIADSRLGSQTLRQINVFNDTRVSYNKTFNRIHHLTANLGVRYQESKTEQDLALSANSATDELTSVSYGTSTTRRTGGDLGHYRRLNTYFSTDYSLSDKYFLSFNVALDGSSRFGKAVPKALQVGGNSYAVLPSLAGAWLISSEDFMGTTRFLDLLKLRASVGYSGNDDVGDFNGHQYYVSQNLLGLQGLVRAGIGNNELQWEKVRKLNIGLDAAFFNERLSITLDAYQNRTDSMLLYESLLTASGMNTGITNSGGMKTTGLEAAVNGRIINHKNLKWDIGLTIGKYTSTITRLPGDIFTDYAGGTYITKVGNRPNAFYGYKTSGVYSSDAEASADGSVSIMPNGTPRAFKGGDVHFMDIDNNDTIDARDRQIIGNPNPDFYGGISTRFEWKRFSLEALFTFTHGNDIYNYTRRQLESENNFYNQTTAVVNRWRANGQVTNIPAAAYGDPAGNSRFSDRWIEDGSYFRLSSATLSYNIPVKAGFLRYSVVYLTGNNIFTLTKYKGYDPEMSPTNSVFGQGVDVTLQPQHRELQLGVRFGL